MTSPIGGADPRKDLDLDLQYDPANAFLQAASFFAPPQDWDSDPTKWGHERLGEYYHFHQREILESIRDNRYTAVQSCHDAGKSFIASRIAAQWIDTHEPGEAFVVSTAPTSAQVSAILWREIARAHRKGRLNGNITTAGYPQWKMMGELVGYGRKPSDYDDSAFQGIHARYVLVIIDEACGVPKQLFDAADALATNENARVLAIGNPDDPMSHFASVCKPDSGWNRIKIDGLRTPNFTREAVEGLKCEQCARVGAEKTLLERLMIADKVPYNEEPVPEGLREMLLSPLWVEERLHRWVGRSESDGQLTNQANQSSLFTAKVRGNFPTSDTEGIIPLGWVEAAVQRYEDWIDKGKPTPQGRRVVGVDVAREGADETCIVIREGDIVTDIRKYRKADTMETTGNVTAALTVPGALAVVDVIGVGGGVVDRLRELDKPNIPFNAAGSAKGLLDRTGEFKFKNLRAAAWWNMRELLDPSRGSTVMLPNSETLKADLCTPRWHVQSGGAIQVETKDDIRKRLGRSTDEGDAVVMAHWIESGAQVDTGQPEVLSWWDDMDTDELVSWGVEGMVDTW